MREVMQAIDPRPARALRAAAVVFAAGSIVHNADHIRRGSGTVTTQLQVAGYTAMVISAIAIILALIGHRLAPVVAVVAGFSLATGFAAAHWLPTWSVLSDSFVSGHVSAFSKFASLLEIAGALAFGLAGLAVVRHTRVSPM